MGPACWNNLTIRFLTHFLIWIVFWKHQDFSKHRHSHSRHGLELQSVYHELQFNVETASPCTNLLKFCWLIFQQYGWVIQQCDAIGRLLHYTKNSLSSPCTSQHKHGQKDKTKTLVKFPDHVFIHFAQRYNFKSENECKKIYNIHASLSPRKSSNVVCTIHLMSHDWCSLSHWPPNNPDMLSDLD